MSHLLVGTATNFLVYLGNSTYSLNIVECVVVYVAQYMYYVPNIEQEYNCNFVSHDSLS